MAQINATPCTNCPETAIYYCLCQFEPLLLCAKHFEAHCADFQSQSHPSYPIVALPYHAIPGYYDRLRKRMQSKRELIAEISRNTERCEACIQEIQKVAEEVISVVQREAEALIEALAAAATQLDREIEQAVHEFEGKIYEEDVQWKSKLAEMLYFAEENRDSLQVFEWGFQPVPQRFLASLLAYSFTDYNTPPPLLSAQPPIAISNSHLVFLLSSDPPLPLDLVLGSNYSATFVSETQLFLCGGLLPSYDISSDVYLVDKGEVSQLLKMKAARHSHGVFYESYWPFVFIFGGESLQDDEGIQLHTCERFALETGQWEDISDMTSARSTFNPSLHKRLIYLCGGLGSCGAIETYSPALNLMRPVSIQLPEDVSGYFGCTTVSDSDSLVVISRETVTKWSPESAEIVTKKRPQSSYVWSSCRPVTQQGKAYLVCSDCCLRVVDVDTGEVEEAIPCGGS